MKYIGYWIILLGVFLALITGCGGDNNVVARIGDEKITLSELEERLRHDYRNKKLKDISEDERLKTLNLLLDDRRKVLAARSEGLEQNDIYQREKRSYDDRTIATALHNDLVVNTVTPESLLKKYYEWQKWRVQVALLRIGHQETQIYKVDGRTPAQADSLGKIYAQQLKESADPLALAKSLSDDKRNDPHLKPYLIGRFPVEIDEKVFTARPGDVLGPLSTDKGLVVMRILSRQPAEKFDDYATIKPQLIRTLRAVQAPREKALFEELSAGFEEKYQMAIYDSTIEDFMAVLVAWGKKPQHTLFDFTPEQRALALGSIQGTDYTAGEVIDYFGARLFREYRLFSNFDNVRNGIIRSTLNLRAWAIEGRARGYDDREETRRLMTDFQQKRMVQLFEQEVVDSLAKAAVTEEDIVAYYQANLERYKLPERITVWQIPVDSRETAQTVLQKARAGQDFAKLNRKYRSKRRKKQDTRFALGWITRESKHDAQLIDAAFNAGPKKFIGPLEINNLHYVLETGPHSAENQQTLEEVRSVIESQVFNEKRNEIREAQLKALREKYTHKINQSVMQRLG